MIGLMFIADAIHTLADSQPTSEAPSLLKGPVVPILLMVGVLYFFVFRAKRRDDKGRKNLLNQLKKGDRIETIGGVLGTIVEAKETEVVVKVDETNNTKMRFSRRAVHRVVDGDKAESK